MAFYGSDSNDRELAQLKKVLNQKDLQLTSLQNEHHKQQKEISQLKKSRDTAVYNLQVEAERAYKAETALALRTNEITQAKLRLDNQESSLNAANERIKAEEKENHKLQYQLDLLSAGSSQTSSKRVQDQEGNLKAQIRQLEQDLKRSESEKETIRHEAAAVSVGGWGLNESAIQSRTGTDKASVISMENEISTLRSENVRLMEELRTTQNGPPSSTSSAFGFAGSDSSVYAGESTRPTSVMTSTSSLRTRRRASSVSIIPQLQSEIQELRSQAANSVSFSELDDIKAQLVAAKKQANKMENEKMALERKARNDADELRSKLDDAQDELNFLRCAEDDASSSKDKQEKAALNAKVAALQAELQAKTEEIQKLEIQLMSLATMESALLEEKNKVAGLQTQLDTFSPPSPSTVDVGLLEAKVVSLEQPLSTSSSTMKDSSSDRKVRQLQRDLAGLEEELKESDRLLAEKENEIFALRTCLPIPSSPTMGTNNATDRAQVRRLEAEVEAQKQVIAERTSRIEDLTAKVQKADSLAAAKDENLQNVQADLSEKMDQLSSSCLQVQNLEEQITTLRADLEAHRLVVANAEAHLRDAETTGEQLKLSQAALTTAEEKLSRLDTQLQMSTQAAQHHEAIRAGLAESASQAVLDREEAAAALGEVQTTLAELQASSEILRIERDEALQAVDQAAERILESDRASAEVHTQQQAALEMIQIQLIHAEGSVVSLKLDIAQLEATIAEGKATFSTMETHRDTLLREHTAMSAELAFLHEEADRSTVSQARDRDVTLFRQKEEIEALHAKLQGQLTESADEIQLITFEKKALATANVDLSIQIKTLTKDLTSLQAQCAALQDTSDTKQSMGSEDVDQLLDAIARLRHERDQLRQSLSFATHLKRFALESNGVDAASALGQLEELKAQLAAAYEAKAKLMAELECRPALSIDISEAVAATQNLPSSSKSLAKLEEVVSGLSLQVETLSVDLVQEQQGREQAEELAKQRLSELDEARASAGEDVRQLLAERLSASVKTTDNAARQLKKDLDEQVQRVIRRDAQIATHQAEIKRLKLNRDLMESSMGDLNEELSAMTVELESAKALLQDAQALQVAQIETISLRQALSAAGELIESLETQLLSLRNDKESALAQAQDLMTHDRQLITSLIINAVNDRDKLATRTDLIRSIASISRLRANELINCRSKIKTQQTDIATLTEKLVETSDAKQHELSAAIDTPDNESASLNAELASARSQISELMTASTAAASLVQSLRGEKATVESELEALVNELSELESSSHQERLALSTELEAARKQNAIAEASVATAESSSADARIELVNASSALEAARRDSKVQKAHSEELHNQLAVAHEALTASEGQVRALQTEVEQEVQLLAQAQQTISVLQASFDGAKSQSELAETAKSQVISELAVALSDLESVRAENSVYQASLQEAQSTAASSLGEQDRLLKALAASVEEKVAMESSLPTSTELTEQLRISRCRETELAEKVSNLECQLRDTQADAERHMAAEADIRSALEVSAVEVASVQQRLVASQAEVAAVAGRLGEGLEANDLLKSKLVTCTDELQSLRKELSMAQKDSKQAVGLLKFEEAKAKNLSKSLQAAHASLEVAQKEAAEAVLQARSIQISVSKLTAENGKLLAALEAKAQSQEQTDMSERISQLEAILNQKMQEVDEADDKVRDAYKTNARLEKKIAKLERKLAVSVLPIMAPAMPAVEPTRTPRAVNVFEPALAVAGGKRGREEPDTEHLPADAIMQPPSTTPGRTPLSLRRALAARHPGFTPTRRVSGESGIKSTTPARTLASRLAFGADITNSVKPVADAPKSESKASAGVPRNAFSVL